MSREQQTEAGAGADAEVPIPTHVQVFTVEAGTKCMVNRPTIEQTDWQTGETERYPYIHMHENYVYAILEPQTTRDACTLSRVSVASKHYALAVAATNPNIMPKSYN